MQPKSRHLAAHLEHEPVVVRDPGHAFPLKPEERNRADEVARRLQLELRGLVELLPESERGATSMSRALEVDRNTCQRIVAATGRGEPNATLLGQLPGISGLRQFTTAIARRLPAGDGAEATAAVNAAIDRFEKVIDELAGSQRKLRERLELDRDEVELSAAVTRDDQAIRRALFRAAADLLGRWSATRLTMRIIRPVPTDPLQTENIRMTGHIGHVARPVAVPLEVYSGVQDQLAQTRGPAFQTLDATQSVGNTPNFLMKSFCTQPLPRVTSRSAGGRMVHTIDEMAVQGEPSDIFVADRRIGCDKHPATQHPPIGEISTVMNFPARRFVMDVFLHRDIARRCIPSLEVHVSPLPSGAMLLSRWSTRIPGGPKLEFLGPGLTQIETDAYPRHREVAEEMFGSVGWNPDEFVGYRCDVVYPIWRAAYCILFDFTGNELPHPIGVEDK